MINVSSPDFIQKLKSKDNEAISFLIENYHEALIKGAMKQGLSFDQAEEVVQATWSTFFEKSENFEARSHIRTYLFGIMYNKVKETWRSNKKYTHDYDDAALDKLFDEDGHYRERPKDPSHWLLNKEFNQVLKKEIDKLPELQRMAFYLKEIQGETTEDICNILKITSTNLGVLIYRAKAHLRLALEKELNK
jgi:RNA polymerase sigma-70 factor (ECF subfamily)